MPVDNIIRENINMANIINVEEKTVIVNHKTRCMDTAKQLAGEENPCKEFKTTLDFSECTEEEILELASKTCIISFRTRNKVNSITEEEFAALMVEPINVHEALKAERRGLTPQQKIEKLASEMKPGELKALIEALNNK
jgi:hypothetical protein